MPRTERNNNTEGEKKKRKSCDEAKEDKSLSKRLKESYTVQSPLFSREIVGVDR